MPLLAASPYDVSKACTDMLARSYHASFGMPVAISRCANIYGGADLNFSRLVPGSVRSALMNDAPILRSDGTPLRDYLFIDDAVSAYLRLAEAIGREDVAGQPFNFGANHPVSVIDLTVAILRACGRSDVEPEIQGSGPIPNEIQQQYLDSGRAARVLDWHPSTGLAEGLGATVSWYRSYFDAHGFD